ncbi:hypothetical protein [Dokdonella ginsengisoli]|uniref:EF-hand domain-containing protein n=1 Tax=Dokdonella ginsengisoli TaxID=363846 RepID=A0ABV9QRV1_9GAMM
MKKTFRTSLLVTLIACAPALAFAQTAVPTAKDPNPPPKAPEWTESDTNRDGYLTKEELIPFPSVLKQFEQIDTDRDGRISEAEYRDWFERK